jgi:hypothetical protein
MREFDLPRADFTKLFPAKWAMGDLNYCTPELLSDLF